MNQFIQTTLKPATNLYSTQHNHRNESDSTAFIWGVLAQPGVYNTDRGGEYGRLAGQRRGRVGNVSAVKALGGKRESSAIYTARQGTGNGSAAHGGRGSSAIYTAGDGAGTAAEYTGDGGAALSIKQGTGRERQRNNSGMQGTGKQRDIHSRGRGGDGSGICGGRGSSVIYTAGERE